MKWNRALKHPSVSLRAADILERLERDYLYNNRAACGLFQMRKDDIPPEETAETDWHNCEEDAVWDGSPVMFRQIATIPIAMKGQDVFYQLAVEASPDAPAPQFLLYEGDKLLSVVDEWHDLIRVKASANGGEHLKLTLRGFTQETAPRARYVLSSRLVTTDRDVRKFYYHLSVLLACLDSLPPESEAYAALLKTIGSAVNALDFSHSTDAEFLQTVRSASAVLEEACFGSTGSQIKISAVGLAHVDTSLALYPEKKALGLFAGMVCLLHKYPDFRLTAGQASIYSMLKKESPLLFEKIQKRIREGRLEPEGGMWTTADTLIPCGEALIRQFLYGKRFYRDEFGKNSEVLFLPESDGFSPSLPQIADGCGIRYCALASDCTAPTAPDAFVWQGIDGTGLLTHLIEREPEGKADALTPERVKKAALRHTSRSMSSRTRVEYGLLTGGPSEDMLECGLRICLGIPGLPQVKLESYGDFFRQLDADVRANGAPLRRRGELSGRDGRSLSTQTEVKRKNRNAERMYQSIEFLHTMAALLIDNDFERYPKTGIDSGWHMLLSNQAFGLLRGEPDAAVLKKINGRYEKLLTDGEYMIANAAERIANSLSVKGRQVTVFNSLGFPRGGAVYLPVPLDENTGVFNTDGAALPMQKTFDGKTIFCAPDIPAMGYRAFLLAPRDDSSAAVRTAKVNGNSVSTAFYELEFSDNMELADIYCKKYSRSVASKGQIGNRLTVFEDREYLGLESGRPDRLEGRETVLDRAINARILENGPVRAVLLITRAYMNSILKQYIILYPDNERIDFYNELELRDAPFSLRVEFPVDVNTDRAAFDTQFGFVERQNDVDRPFDDVCAHRWADLSDNGFGVALLNDSRYGYCVKDGKLGLTLLRREPTSDGEKGNTLRTFTYSICPHDGQNRFSTMQRQGADLNVPLLTAEAQGRGALPDNFSLLYADKANIVIGAMKKAEDSDGVIVRLYECANARTSCRVQTGMPIDALYSCDLLEQDDKKLPAERTSFTLSFRPLEIKTIKIFFE